MGDDVTNKQLLVVLESIASSLLVIATALTGGGEATKVEIVGPVRTQS